MNTPCATCGVTIPKHPGRGRPRKYCADCRRAVRPQSTARKPSRECDQCGAPTPSSRHRRCGPDCDDLHRKRYAREKKRSEIRAEVGNRRCAYCLRDFTWNQFGFKSRKFCTRKCARNWRPMVEKVCDECGETFLGRQHINGAKRCQRCVEGWARQAARRRAAALRKIERAAAGSAGSRWLISGRCTICADTYTHVATGSYVRRSKLPTCGRPECDATHAAKVRRIAHHSAKVRRRAREQSAFIARVDPIEVHERCGWKCHLCGKPVRRDVLVPDALAPTIDHVVPLAQGGTHEPINCRTAHFLCNSIKGDELPEQLPLLGWAS